MSLKKTSTLYTERCELKRNVFLKKVLSIDKDKIVYIDESGIDKFVSREYGWAPKGIKVFGNVSGRRFARESFISGLLKEKFIAPLCYNVTCDTILFNFWLKKFLSPSICARHTIILDNATFHKSCETKEIIESSGCTILFLPAYLPDLNPIEKCWANLTNVIKKVVNKFKNLADA